MRGVETEVLVVWNANGQVDGVWESTQFRDYISTRINASCSSQRYRIPASLDSIDLGAQNGARLERVCAFDVMVPF